MSESSMTRRDFLRTTAAAAVVGTAGMSLLAQPNAQKKANVVLIRHQHVIDSEGKLNPKIPRGDV